MNERRETLRFVAISGSPSKEQQANAESRFMPYTPACAPRGYLRLAWDRPLSVTEIRAVCRAIFPSEKGASASRLDPNSRETSHAIVVHTLQLSRNGASSPSTRRPAPRPEI